MKQGGKTLMEEEESAQKLCSLAYTYLLLLYVLYACTVYVLYTGERAEAMQPRARGKDRAA